MLHKKQKVAVASRRSITTFFNRVTEIFERKFDGFVATVEDTNAAEVDNSNNLNLDVGAVIDAITDAILDQEQTPLCPDLTPEGAATCGQTVVIDSYPAVRVISKSWTVQNFPYPGGSVSALNPSFSTFAIRQGYETFNGGATITRENRYMYFEPADDEDIINSSWVTFIDSLHLTSYIDAPEIPVNIMMGPYDTTGASLDVDTEVPDEHVVWSGIIPASDGISAGSLEVDGTFTVDTTGVAQLYLRLPDGDLPYPGSEAWGVTLTNIVPFNFADAFFSDCSGDTILENLTYVTDHWETTQPAETFARVWIDGLVAVEGTDYTVCDGSICLNDPDLDTVVVTARYVVE